MFSQNEKVAGLLLLVGGILYLWLDSIGVHYSNFDLVNVGLVLLGVLMIAGAYFIQVAFKSMLFTILIVLAAIGTLVIGVVPYGGPSSLYYPFAYLGYVFFALSAIMSYKFEKSPLKYVSIILGVLSLLGLVLWVSGVEISSGITVSPTVIDYLILPWLITFGAYIAHE
jgi:hypothetical protein